MATAVDPRWIRNASDRLAAGQGCTFDEDAGGFPVEFIQGFCKQSKARWAGQPLSLLDWQKDFLMRLFGWKRPDGLRRFRRAYLEVAKKNGKSTMLSALVLFLLLADGEGGPDIYLNACDRAQARIIFDEAAKMVEASPDLAARLDVVKSAARIVWEKGNGVIRANSADAPNKDGLNPSGIVFDELHRQPDRQLWDIFEYAAASRLQPLTISITTAGEDASGVWHEQREYSEQVNAGTIPDITHLGVVYRAMPEDDIDSRETWIKANPSLGETIRWEDFARELEEAKQVPAKLANFKRLRLNIIARGAGKFLAAGRWEACEAKPPPRPEALRALPCYAGLDLSSIDDLTALAALFGDERAGYFLRFRFFLPEDNIVALERKHKVPYRAWADAGWIILTPGEVIDYGFVREEVLDLAGDFDLRKLMLDPYQATQLATQLSESDGVPVEYLRQGFLSLSAPTKALLRLVLSGPARLRHDGNPIARWMASNAVAETDAADNIKLSKKKSRLKIDGMAAAVNALAGAMAAAGEDGDDSVYDSRGLIFL